MDLKELYKALKGAQSCMSNGFACQLCPYNGPRRECSEELRDDVERAVEQVKKALENENTETI